MNIHHVMLIAAWLILTAIPVESHAQTCRVSSGPCAFGATQSYMEVFELDYVDEKPEFPGGSCDMLKFINEHRQYPREAYSEGIEGRVTCSFVVNADGSISNISVIKGVESSLNEEAVRVISSMPAWRPGKIQGVSVPVRVICAVPFRK